MDLYWHIFWLKIRFRFCIIKWIEGHMGELSITYILKVTNVKDTINVYILSTSFSVCIYYIYMPITIPSNAHILRINWQVYFRNLDKIKNGDCMYVFDIIGEMRIQARICTNKRMWYMRILQCASLFQKSYDAREGVLIL